jgi:hypothetical protein
VVFGLRCYTIAEAQIDLYAKLADAETDVANGDKGVDFNAFAQELRAKVHGYDSLL